MSAAAGGGAIGSDSSRVECPTCGKLFTRHDQLLLHMQVHAYTGDRAPNATPNAVPPDDAVEAATDAAGGPGEPSAAAALSELPAPAAPQVAKVTPLTPGPGHHHHLVRTADHPQALSGCNSAAAAAAMPVAPQAALVGALPGPTPPPPTANTSSGRPFKCAVCATAFRVMGHLGKHFRSKSHLRALEKAGLLKCSLLSRIESLNIPLQDIIDQETGSVIPESLNKHLRQADPAGAALSGRQKKEEDAPAPMGTVTIVATPPKRRVLLEELAKEKNGHAALLAPEDT